jgi:hypothetical protein
MTRCQILLETTDSSLRLLSLVSLYTAIYLPGDIFDTGLKKMPDPRGSTESAQTLIKAWFQHPVMSRSTPVGALVYGCPIAKSMASKLAISAEKLVRQMADSVISTAEKLLPSGCDPLTKVQADRLVKSLQVDTTWLDTTWLEFDLDVTQEGWLKFEFDDRAIQTWLLHYAPQPTLALPRVICSEVEQGAIERWHCWYAYQRCSSLLDQLDNWSPQLAQFPDQIDPVIRPLLLDCLSYIEQLEESLESPTAKVYLKLGGQISQVFEKLTRQYSSRQILHESTVALGLVILIQRLLKSLLEAGIGDEIVRESR